MKRNLNIFAVLSILLLLTACGTGNNAAFENGFVPAVQVLGDVDAALTLNRALAENFGWTTVDNEGTELPAILLADIVAAAGPRAAQYEIYLVGADGLTSMIEGDDLTGCHVAFSRDFGWECVNLNHPISSKVKMLAKIIVVTKEGVLDPAAVGIVGADGVNRTVTAGALMVQPYCAEIEFEGKSEINGKSVTVFTPLGRIAVSSVLTADKEVCAVGKNGELYYDRNFADAFIEIGKNSLDYVSGGHTVADIAGIMADPPKITIAAVFEDALHFLGNDERVLIIELDGWGYEMFRRGAQSQPFLSSLEAQRALAAYPSISPVGLATMLTGTLPDTHGIRDRGTREFTGDDLFQRAAALGKTVFYVEGETSLIHTSVQPELSADLSGDGYTDEEVFANVTEGALTAADLVFVHFHGIDDEATASGPYSAKTLARMAAVDGMVRALCEQFDGRVIITADHGLHETAEGGTHGQFLYEDMVVPYIITRGGNA